VQPSLIDFANAISWNSLDHWQDANATWHRHPADVLSPLILLSWYKSHPPKKAAIPTRFHRAGE
jgi:hypothetical protein